MADRTASVAIPVGLEGHDALIVVDVQNDFMPGGALAVPGGDEIVPGVNALMERFADEGLTVVLTQDWHPAGHRSFASAHRGKRPFDPHEEPGVGPVLWPDHCVQESLGADFHPALRTGLAHVVLRKGTRRGVDSYSGFLENDRATPTGLAGCLKDRGVKRIFVCGLALDYCVFFTAADGVRLGFEVFVLAELCRAVSPRPEDRSRIMDEMASIGIRVSVDTKGGGGQT
ncbi:MAG TPA: bifunctional nicotinamidase/pyrazinamidase [Deltaproteobacteria bacterium]|nr:bifunctional nicotinamidase/pyrazinamidase [Deltaproteobacteria bacterium]